MEEQFNIPEGRQPLLEYTWAPEVDRMLQWGKTQSKEHQCFLFDVVISLAFIDATAGLTRFIEKCPNCPEPYNLHLGFINLCSPCYESLNLWKFQKAAKPQSGTLGKISSEVILRFIEQLSDNILSVESVGGVHEIDAVLNHTNGETILAEVKCAPLITYPVLFQGHSLNQINDHEKPNYTNSQFQELDSALYLHGSIFLPLGKAKDEFWPFRNAADFLINPENESAVNSAVEIWGRAKQAYKNRDRDDPMYYLANASGRPPRVARDRDRWPSTESISDGKTSAGMDRTDDIKKGIYQSLKIGTKVKLANVTGNLKTAIVSNLPAYRHGVDYVDPFVGVMWGLDSDIELGAEFEFIRKQNLNHIFDYIITIDDPVLRGIEL